MLNPYLDNLSCWKNKEWIMLVWSLSSAAWEQHSVRKYSVMTTSRFICLIRPNRGLAVKYLQNSRQQRPKTSKWIIAACLGAWSPRGKKCMQEWAITQYNTAPKGFTQVKPPRCTRSIFWKMRLPRKRLQHEDDIMTSGAISISCVTGRHLTSDSRLIADCPGRFLLWLGLCTRLPSRLLWSRTQFVFHFTKESGYHATIRGAVYVFFPLFFCLFTLKIRLFYICILLSLLCISCSNQITFMY